jgi:nucleotide-binding universal stress UspA family protein
MSTSISPFAKILVPLDQSENATRALEYALKLAKLAKSEITLLCVINPISNTADSYISASQLEDLLEESAKNYLEDLVKKTEKVHGMRVKTTVKRGPPVSVIIDIAQEEHMDLIVMGSRGLGGFKEMLFGSVSHGVTSHANVPVMIVK